MNDYTQALQLIRAAKDGLKEANDSRSAGVHLLARIIEALAEASEYTIIQGQKEIALLKQRIEQLEGSTKAAD